MEFLERWSKDRSVNAVSKLRVCVFHRLSKNGQQVPIPPESAVMPLIVMVPAKA